MWQCDSVACFGSLAPSEGSSLFCFSAIVATISKSPSQNLTLQLLEKKTFDPVAWVAIVGKSNSGAVDIEPGTESDRETNKDVISNDCLGEVKETDENY